MRKTAIAALILCSSLVTATDVLEVNCNKNSKDHHCMVVMESHLKEVISVDAYVHKKSLIINYSGLNDYGELFNYFSSYSGVMDENNQSRRFSDVRQVCFTFKKDGITRFVCSVVHKKSHHNHSASKVFPH